MHFPLEIQFLERRSDHAQHTGATAGIGRSKKNNVNQKVCNFDSSSVAINILIHDDLLFFSNGNNFLD
jgi:hypothetical protein